NKVQYIESNLKKINEIAKKQEPVKYYNDRLTLLLLACNTIEEVCALYRQERIKNPFIEPSELIRCEYLMSKYANLCYVTIKNMISFYYSNRETEEELKTVTRDKIDLLYKYKFSICYIAARWSVERFIESYDEDKP